MRQVFEMNAPIESSQSFVFDIPTSMLWLRAMENDSEAQNCLGTAFLEGIGVEQNSSAAYYWYKSACNLGCVNALSNLAYLYVQGIYVKQNYSFARLLIEEAVSRGCPHAENNLGVMIGCGFTEEADPTVAKVSFAIAAGKGVKAAQMNLEWIALAS
jgi:hypothetical protein